MRTQKIILLAVMFAIMIAFLIFFPLNAVVPLIALIVIAETGDFKLATLGGLLFGVASLCSALFVPSTPLYVAFLNPLVSIVPRIIVGIVVYSVYKGLFQLLKGDKFSVSSSSEIYMELSDPVERNKARKVDYIALTAGALLGAMTNTVLVLGTIFLLYTGNTYTLEDMSILVKPSIIIPLVIPSIISELVVCAIVVPPIVTALKHTR